MAPRFASSWDFLKRPFFPTCRRVLSCLMLQEKECQVLSPCHACSALQQSLAALVFVAVAADLQEWLARHGNHNWNAGGAASRLLSPLSSSLQQTAASWSTFLVLRTGVERRPACNGAPAVCLAELWITCRLAWALQVPLGENVGFIVAQDASLPLGFARGFGSSSRSW